MVREMEFRFSVLLLYQEFIVKCELTVRLWRLRRIKYFC